MAGKHRGVFVRLNFQPSLYCSFTDIVVTSGQDCAVCLDIQLAILNSSPYTMYMYTVESNLS